MAKRQKRIPKGRSRGHAGRLTPSAPSGPHQPPHPDRAAKATTPTTVFKYGSISPQNLANLEAKGVYFSSPLNFNDPYDCALTVGLVEPTAGDVEAMRRRYMAGRDVPEYLRIHFASLPPGELKETLVRSMRATLDMQRRKYLATAGVCCFSEVKDELLMWGHYGDRYRGMCLEFRTDYEPFKKIHRVVYVDRMPRIDIRRVSVGRDAAEVIESLLCTKSRSWRYEREWRCLHVRASTLFHYPAEALKGVYFGPQVDRAALECARRVLADHYPGVELYMGRRILTEFRVEFDRLG